MLYDTEVIWRKTIKHAFPIYYTLIKERVQGAISMTKWLVRFHFVLVYVVSELLDGSNSSASPVRSSVPVGSGLTWIVIGGRSLILISFLNNSPMGFYRIVTDMISNARVIHMAL